MRRRRPVLAHDSGNWLLLRRSYLFRILKLSEISRWRANFMVGSESFAAHEGGTVLCCSAVAVFLISGPVLDSSMTAWNAFGWCLQCTRTFEGPFFTSQTSNVPSPNPLFVWSNLLGLGANLEKQALQLAGLFLAQVIKRCGSSADARWPSKLA